MSQLQKQAPQGYYRVIGCDNPKDPGWMKGDFSDIETAKEASVVKRNSFVLFKIYDDSGKCVHSSEWE